MFTQDEDLTLLVASHVFHTLNYVVKALFNATNLVTKGNEEHQVFVLGKHVARMYTCSFPLDLLYYSCVQSRREGTKLVLF